MKLTGMALTAVLALGVSAAFADDKPGDSCGACGMSAATTQPAQTPAADKPVNTKCPILGEAIDPKITTTYQGKTIAFCCKDCIDDFKKDPEKYMKDLK